MNRFKSGFRTLMGRYRTSVSMQLLSAVLVVSSAVTLITTGTQLALNYNDEVNDLKEDLEFIQKGYSADITQSLWDMNESQAQATLKGILTLPGIKYVEIAEGKKILFSAGKLPLKNTLSRTFPLEYRKKSELIKLGQMTVVANLDHIYGKLRKTLLYIFLTQLIKTMVVSTLVLLIIRHILIRHLIAMTDYLRKLDFSRPTDDLQLLRNKPRAAQRASERESDELDIMVHAINRMRATLYQSYEDLSTFNLQLEQKVEERTQQLKETQRIIIEQQNTLVASAKMSALGEMAGGIAHEINNPLAAIQGLSFLMKELMVDGKLNPAEMTQMLSSMVSLTERIARIIQGLRSFSRDGSRDPIEQITLRGLIETTLSFCAERFKAHDISLEIDPSIQDLSFQGRETELSQVLLNLLNNSFDAVSGQKEKWIRISAKGENKYIEIRITDSGPGIPVEIQKKMFQPFFTTKEPGKGTGLGLSISFGILQAHRGDLRLDEKTSHTSFILRVPKEQIAVAEPAIS